MEEDALQGRAVEAQIAHADAGALEGGEQARDGERGLFRGEQQALAVGDGTVRQRAVAASAIPRSARSAMPG